MEALRALAQSVVITATLAACSDLRSTIPDSMAAGRPVDLGGAGNADTGCGPAPAVDGSATRVCVDQAFRWVHPEPGTIQTRVARVLSFGSNDAWAAGGGLLLRWDGKVWRRPEIPIPVDGWELWGSSPQDVWVSAESWPRPTLLHWNGVTFEVLPLPFLTPQPTQLDALTGNSREVWVALRAIVGGEGKQWLLRRACGRWEETPTPVSPFVNGLMITELQLHEDGSAWALTNSAEVWRWGAGRWENIPTRGFEPEESMFQYNELKALWSPSPDEVWVAGVDRAGAHRRGVYRGGRDMIKPFREWPLESKVLGIGGTPNDVRVVGSNGRIEHWDGAAWLGERSGTTEPLVSADSYWAVADEGWLLQRTGATWRLARGWEGTPARSWEAGWALSPTVAWVVGAGASRWDGRAWLPVPAAAGERLEAVWGRSANEVWLGGDKLFRWNGATLQQVQDSLLDPKPSVVYVQDIWGPRNGRDVWFVITNRIYRWNGARAVEETPPEVRPPADVVYGIGGAADGLPWAGGRVFDRGVIWRRFQDGWRRVYEEAGTGFGDPIVVNDMDVWISSSGPLHWDGVAWRRKAVAKFYGGVALTGTDVWFMGPGFGPWRFDGKEWSCVKNVPSVWTIFGSGPNDVWLGGWGGQLLHKGP